MIFYILLDRFSRLDKNGYLILIMELLLVNCFENNYLCLSYYCFKKNIHVVNTVIIPMHEFFFYDVMLSCMLGCHLDLRYDDLN